MGSATSVAAGFLSLVVRDLNESQPDLAQTLHKSGLGLAQSAAEAFEQARQGVDRQLGLRQLGGLAGKVKRSEVPKAHGVVGDHQFRRGTAKLLLNCFELLLGALYLFGARFVVARPGVAGLGGGARRGDACRTASKVLATSRRGLATVCGLAALANVLDRAPRHRVLAAGSPKRAHLR